MIAVWVGERCSLFRKLLALATLIQTAADPRAP